ncbi:MAG: DUF2974 domain-containing protein [Oscillospiraceae bacterium]|nr:DUF2974 domain-containing protein [Oscillospiraceae bacterium]
MIENNINIATEKQESRFFEISFPKKEESISIIEYAEKQMKTFEQQPFGPVDSLVLSQLAYMNLGCIVPSVAVDDTPVRIADLYKAEFFSAILDDVRDSKSNRKLLNALCCSPRYRDIRINYFIDNIDPVAEKQFCAMTFILPDNNVYIAYRGTDATIVGWKEDFNMFFRSVIPGHISAVHYIQTVAQRLGGNIYVGGHSKGGNLAVFGASFAGKEIQDRIIKVFNHDGPGLSSEIQALKDFVNLNDVTDTTVPQASLFGLMFSSDDFMVVKSDRMGIMQHDPFSWEISGDDFIYADGLKSNANKLVFTIYDLMKNLSREDRELFIDTVFKVIASPGVSSFTEWPAMAVKEFDTLVNAMKSIDETTAEKLKSVMAEFVKTLGKNILNLPDKDKIKEFITEKVNSIGKKDK